MLTETGTVTNTKLGIVTAIMFMAAGAAFIVAPSVRPEDTNTPLAHCERLQSACIEEEETTGQQGAACAQYFEFYDVCPWAEVEWGDAPTTLERDEMMNTDAAAMFMADGGEDDSESLVTSTPVSSDITVSL